MPSWLQSANAPTGFGLHHLPFGLFDHEGTPHLCSAIGDQALDLHTLAPSFPTAIAAAFKQPNLNAFLALGAGAWRTAREHLQHLLIDPAHEPHVHPHLHPRATLTLLYPLSTRGFVDFYASIDHARRVGELFRPDNPLLPNYTHVPIAYNGRASSLVVSGTPIRRPWGQRKPTGEGEAPTFAPTAALDYELELAFITGHGNVLGEPITTAEARASLFGVALLNDWSARDIQSWEYQPLGPFLGKSFSTTLSPWITPMLALEPFRIPQRERDEPLSYLRETDPTPALSITTEVWLSTPKHRDPMQLSASDTRDLFWTPAQMLTHAASNGAPLETGDVFGSGTLSGPTPESAGCLLELTQNGRTPITLPDGETRAWLEDGDEVILRATATKEGHEPITLGECTGRIHPAHRDILPR